EYGCSGDALRILEGQSHSAVPEAASQSQSRSAATDNGPGISAIDVSAMGSGWLRHSYFSDTWPLLSDIHAMLSADTPPSRRFGLREVKAENGSHYVFR